MYVRLGTRCETAQLDDAGVGRRAFSSCVKPSKCRFCFESALEGQRFDLMSDVWYINTSCTSLVRCSQKPVAQQAFESVRSAWPV